MTDANAAAVVVAVGIDYETDEPWVWTGPKVVDDCEDASGWFSVEVPADMAQRFRKAADELSEAVKAIHDHVGYDAVHSRLREACDNPTGCVITVGERTYEDDCDRCGWPLEAHTEYVGGTPNE